MSRMRQLHKDKNTFDRITGFTGWNYGTKIESAV
jgi:hypothetical protein